MDVGFFVPASPGAFYALFYQREWSFLEKLSERCLTLLLPSLKPFVDVNEQGIINKDNTMMTKDRKAMPTVTGAW